MKVKTLIQIIEKEMIIKGKVAAMAIIIAGMAVGLTACGGSDSGSVATEAEHSHEEEHSHEHEHESEEAKDVAVVYEYTYSGLVPGETYTMDIDLIDKSGVELNYHGSSFGATHEFVAEAESGVTSYEVVIADGEYEHHEQGFIDSNVRQVLIDMAGNEVKTSVQAFTNGER